MNILITHYSMCDYGGLVNDTEIMTYQFKKMGHSVSNIMLTPKSYGLKIGGGVVLPRSSGYELGIGTGLYIHHKSGWLGMDRFGFTDVDKLKEWKSYVKQFDLIIHQTPVPTMRKEYCGTDAWVKLYNNNTPQIVISPDANFRDAYPHLYQVIKRIRGVVCTHEASFRACEKLPVPRILLPGPHIIDKADVNKRVVAKRRAGFCSVQNFKPIKRMETLIRSIPHMKKSTLKIVAGGGIEYHYMTSKTKVKEKYLDDTGRPIWDAALDAGMDFRGYVSNNERDKIMTSVTSHVDCSWSKKYTALGPHFNRTFIEAMKNGCVPVCTDLGMDDSDIFKADKNYVRILANDTPRNIANAIESAIRDPRLMKNIRSTNAASVSMFNSKYVCEQLIKLGRGNGEATGLLGLECGHDDKEIRKLSRKVMEFFK